MSDGGSKNRNMFIDILIVATAVALLALTWAIGSEVGKPLKKGMAAVWLGTNIIYLGVLFLMSYFFSRKSHVLSALMWICENFSNPRGRHMALFYFALGLAIGLSALFIGFGIL